MVDNTLSFETRVDLSGLNSGFDTATATIQTASQRMATAIAAAKVATNQLASAQEQLGAAAAGGNASAIAIIQEYQQEVANTQAAVDSLKESQKELAAAAKGAADAQHSQVSAMAATSGEIRLLEGAIPIRAVENFLAKTLELGPIMQAAFPVFGAIALGEVLVDIGKKALSLYDNFLTLKGEGQDLAKGLAQDGDAIAKTWGNTLELLHTTGMRDNPIGTLRMDATDAALAIQGLQSQVANLNKDLQNAQSLRTSGNYYGQGTSEEGNDNRISGDTSRIARLQEQITGLNAQIADKQSQINKKEDVSGPKGPDPQIQALRDLEEGLNKAKLAMDVSAQDEANYWSSSLQLFTDGSAQYESIMQKIVSANHKVSEEFGKDVLKEVEDDQRRVEEAQKVSDSLVATYDRISKQQEEAAKVQQEFNAEVAKGQEIQAQNAANLESASISIAQQSGFITKLGADHATAAIHAQEYADKLAALKQQLDAINAEHPTDQAGVNDQEKRAVGVQNQMSQVQGQAQVSGLKDSAAQAQDLAQPYLTAFNDINNGFLQVQNKMILGTQSISRSFAQMGANLVVSVADGFEKMLAKQVESEIRAVALHATTITQKTALDTTGAATSEGIAHTTSQTQGFDAAKLAFKNTYAEVSGWPFVGPVLAPVLAAGAFAAVAAFETGGIIPNTGIAMVHQGEAVLPANLTNFLLNSASTTNNSSSNSSVGVTQNFRNAPMGDRQFRQMMNRNAVHVTRTVQKGLRESGKA